MVNLEITEDLVEVFQSETEIGELLDGFVGFSVSSLFCLGGVNGWSDESNH